MGRSHLKAQVAERIDIDASLLPYHAPFLEYLHSEHDAGRALVLVTASNEKFAHKVAGHLGIFDRVLGSTAEVNLKGRSKLKMLTEHYGPGGFDYAGNGKADLPLLEAADQALLVNPERGVLKAARRQGEVARVFDNRDGRRQMHYLRALRLHQWLKNILIFVPLVMAHRWMEPELLVRALLAFAAFGLCASSVYVLNDLLDLNEDRQHPSKRQRPLAAGAIPLVAGVALVPLLLVGSLAVALWLPVEFFQVLGLYFVVTLAYSLRLKKSAVVDVIALAGLYTLRIIAGAAAVAIMPSFWLLAFAMFLFLSLALVKRYTELQIMQEQGRGDAAGRGYLTTDLEALAQFGSASAFAAVMVLALYVNSDTVAQLYSYPYLIWLLCPLVLYLVMRIWLLARRGVVEDDPLVFLLGDRRSQAAVVLGGILLWLAA